MVLGENGINVITSAYPLICVLTCWTDFHMLQSSKHRLIFVPSLWGDWGMFISSCYYCLSVTLSPIHECISTKSAVCTFHKCNSIPVNLYHVWQSSLYTFLVCYSHASTPFSCDTIIHVHLSHVLQYSCTHFSCAYPSTPIIFLPLPWGRYLCDMGGLRSKPKKKNMGICWHASNRCSFVAFWLLRWIWK